MQRQIGSILLVAGTCIGSGMIALPMVLAKLGVLPSLFLMVATWALMYYTSLVNLELNLQAGRGMSLGALGKRFSGAGAQFVGIFSLKLLCYALFAVFIYGSASVLQELLAHSAGAQYSFFSLVTAYSVFVFFLLLLPIKVVDYLNRLLFFALLAIVALLLAGLVTALDWAHIPLFAENVTDFSAWAIAVPIVFTSFGFQVIFHTLTDYCNKDAVVLKRAFFWGSLIPAVVYSVWTASVLSVIFHDAPDFYSSMVTGSVEVGDLVRQLSAIAQWHFVQLLVWWISLLAIVTSVLGVGVGLCDSFKSMISSFVPSESMRAVCAALITVVPAYCVVLLVPNAFIALLGFSGMILAVIAILLPLYLLYTSNPQNFYYAELKQRWLLWLSGITGLFVMGCQLYNIVQK